MPVRIAAPSLVCSHFIIPLIPQLKTIDRSLTFDFKLSDSHSNVVNEQIDIGIRVDPAIKDNRFITRSIGKFSFVIVATPDVIHEWGNPETLEQLEKMPLVALSNASTNKLWPWSFSNKLKYIPSTPILTCDDAESELQAVLAGVGFGRLPSSLVKSYVQQVQLIEVLTDFKIEGPWDVFIYRPQRGPVPHRVKVVFDYLVASLAME